MAVRKTRVAVVFGGRSAEHEVSLQSARNVVASLDPEKYDPVLIGIDREGRWFLNGDSIALLNAADPRLIGLNTAGAAPVALTPDGPSRALVDKASGAALAGVDVLFPVLHGPYGEDGSIQGLAKLANLPCVGADVLGSAVGMDKDVMKRLLRDAGLEIGPFLAFGSEAEAAGAWDRVKKELGGDVFVKPANLGSSVGVSHAKTEAAYKAAVAEAFRYDLKIVVEKTIVGREIEVAVLGNDEPFASVPGEILPSGDFYSYDAKYVDEHGAVLSLPADLDAATAERARETAVAAYRALCLKGMARVDSFLLPSGRILVNEANTIPGFTDISMYPKLMELSGVPTSRLLDELIRLAVEDFERRSRLESRPR